MNARAGAAEGIGGGVQVVGSSDGARSDGAHLASVGQMLAVIVTLRDLLELFCLRGSVHHKEHDRIAYSTPEIVCPLTLLALG